AEPRKRHAPARSAGPGSGGRPGLRVGSRQGGGRQCHPPAEPAPGRSVAPGQPGGRCRRQTLLYGGARRRVVPRARLGGNRQSLLRLRYGARPRRKSTGLPARRLLNPVTRGRSLKLTVVIPCYNECSTVAELI